MPWLSRSTMAVAFNPNTVSLPLSIGKALSTLLYSQVAPEASIKELINKTAIIIFFIILFENMKLPCW